MSQPAEPSCLSRRTFFRLSSGLLAVTAIGVPAGRADAASGAADKNRSTNLAGFRPVQVSSTDYAPTPGEFAIDGISAVGDPAGTGWRAAAGDPQWISADLQAVCRVDAIGLVFEATRDTQPFVPSGGDPRANTLGNEILSSCAVAYSVAVSTDGQTWQDVHTTTDGAGGTAAISLANPVPARWVRLTVTERSNANPLGLGEFQVYGEAPGDRPAVTCWTTPRNKVPGPPPDLAVAADGTVAVETGWELVLAALVADGALPDPVAGMNNLLIPEALCRHSWWYRREFRVPARLSGDRVWLEFDGVNHEADVWLDGTNVGTLTYPFARATFDVTGILDGGMGQHVLAVRITPLPHPGSPCDKANGVSFVNFYELELDAPTYACASGWDWMPAIRDRASGIWNHVRLRATGDVVIGDPQITTTLPNLPATNVADVAITVPVRNAAPVARTVTVRAAFGSVRVTGTGTVAAGATATVTLAPQQVTNPELWWPNGYGPANLYDLTLTATTAGARSDVRTLRFGIRQIDYEYQRPSVISGQQQVVTFDPAQARYVRFYGYGRATIYGFSFYTLSVFGPADPSTDLALHQPATASSTDSASDGPGNAVDGDPTTRWSSAYQDNQWLQVDLGSVIDVDRVDLTWETAIAKTFAIETSTDGTTWTTAQSVAVGGLHLVRLELQDAAGTAGTVPVTVLQRGQAGDRTTVTVRVQNTGAAVAPMVVLSLRANGERVLPTVYPDNYLWLLPAESRDIDSATTDLGGHSPAVQVTAYGATPTMVSA